MGEVLWEWTVWYENNNVIHEQYDHDVDMEDNAQATKDDERL